MSSASSRRPGARRRPNAARRAGRRRELPSCATDDLSRKLTEDKYDNRVLLVKTTQVTHCFLEKAPSRIELLKPRAMEVAGNVWIGDACSADVVAGGSHIPEALKWPPFAALVLCASEFDGYGSNPAVPVENCGDDLHRAMTATSAAASRGILRDLAGSSDAGPVLVCGVDRRDTRPVVAAVGALVLRGWTLQDAWAAVLKARPGAKIGPKRWRALVQAFGDEVEGIQAAACEICPAAFAPAPAPSKRETEPGSLPPAPETADPSRPLRINVPLKQ